MKITSCAFVHNQNLPKEYSCDGEGKNPPLEIADVPEYSKSLALILSDPDAPNGDFVHWILYNIPAKTTKIAQSSIPDGAAEGANSGGKKGYYPPCPPSGIHRYIFTLYALDTLIDFPANPDKAAILKSLSGHIIDQAELIGLYGRES